MATYRVYFLDPSGRISTSKEYEHFDDATALATISTRYPSRSIEIWRDDLLLVRQDGEPSAPMPRLF